MHDPDLDPIPSMKEIRAKLFQAVSEVTEALSTSELISLIEFAQDIQGLGLLDARKLSAIRLRRTLMNSALARHEGDVQAAALDLVHKELTEPERDPDV